MPVTATPTHAEWIRAELDHALAVFGDELVSDEHDDPECTCDACVRTRARAEHDAMQREAHALGGSVSTFGREVLGELLTDEERAAALEGGRMMDVGQLAQNQLGNIFAELQRLGQQGRDACHGDVYTARVKPDPVPRSTISTALDYAESLIEFARAQLGYLPYARFGIGEPVAFIEAGGTERVGKFGGIAANGRARVRIETLSPPDGDGGGTALTDVTTHEVPESDLRKVAV
jgi:hypothetical protein